MEIRDIFTISIAILSEAYLA